ncbi:MAG TPA: hypothetical protein VJY42_03660 [Candidatus Methanomethylophilaceae archaeon]|nr:hypothetical protein [Candidatus Methanomethylophilaceae archaeon]
MDEIIILGIFSMVAMVVTIVLLSLLDRMRKKVLSKHRSSGGGTYFLDDSDSEKKCAICLGRIKTDAVAVCPCGKLFHDSCAAPTKICPYCGKSYNHMKTREPKRARCPICGRFLSGSMCACGAIFPKRDDTIICSCGNTVDCSRPLCGRCGALYEKVEKQPIKKRKDKTRVND